MKILEIGLTDKIGGMEMYFHNYYYYFEKDFHFDFIDMYNGLYFADEYQKNGSKVITVPFFKANPVKCFFAIRKAIKTGDYDAVHINMLSTANIVPFLAAKMSGTKVIVHSHNSDVPSGKIRQILHRINQPVIGKLADARFACSDLAGKWMFKNKPFRIIPNAMDISKYAFNEETRKEIRDMFNIGDSFVLGHVGRFQEQKNHKYIVKIFDAYHKKNKNSKLMLVGQGELQNEIKADLTSLGLIDDVIIINESNEVEKLYQAMDVFILPSLFEGLSLVAIEAQLSGLPCLFSDTLTKETKITNNVEFIGIDDCNIEVWSNEIKAYQEKNNSRICKLLNESFNISKSIKCFENSFESVK